MDIEYEATFINVDKDDIRARLKKAGATLVRKEFMQKRVAFKLPTGHEIKGGWLRVRDEGDKVTMSLKVLSEGKIEGQHETQIVVDKFDKAIDLLTQIGCVKKAYQESKRELWELDDTEITIDEWPFLEPLVEIEGNSEESVKSVSEKLGFDYNDARFCSADTFYSEKYGISKDRVNNTPEILFNKENPFLN